jgi:hypothetical protein
MRKKVTIWSLALSVVVHNACSVTALIMVNFGISEGKSALAFGAGAFGLYLLWWVAREALTNATTDRRLFIAIVGAFEMAFVSLQICYTEAFAVIGIHGAENTVTHDLQDALYFSLVTWTTTGYGDLSPIGVGRWLACSEALIGTAFNGLALASVIYHLNLRAQRIRT